MNMDHKSRCKSTGLRMSPACRRLTGILQFVHVVECCSDLSCAAMLPNHCLQGPMSCEPRQIFRASVSFRVVGWLVLCLQACIMSACLKFSSHGLEKGMKMGRSELVRDKASLAPVWQLHARRLMSASRSTQFPIEGLD